MSNVRERPAGGEQHVGDGAELLRITEFLRRYADEHMNSRLIDERRCMPPSVVLDVGRAGLLGLQIEREYGGLQLSNAETFQVIAQTAAIDPNLLLLVGVQNSIGIPPIRRFATERRKAEVLPLLAKGAGLATIAASEPGAGSNVRGITTTARRTADGGYVLNGHKSWISLGSWAAYVNVFAQLEDDNGNPLGITGFLVDGRAEGFIPGAEVLTFGMKGIPQNHITLRDLRLGPDTLLGPEGEGLSAAQTSFMAGRTFIGAASTGAMKRCLQIATRYARRRDVASGRLLDNGRTQEILTDCVAATRAVEALTFRVAALLDEGRTVPPEFCFACKIGGSELLWQVIDRSVQLLGARGYLDTNIVGQFFRDYRLFRIFEGATEAVTGYLGSLILKDVPGFLGLLSEHFGSAAATPRLGVALAELASRAQSVDPPAQHILANTAGDLGCWSILAAAAALAADTPEAEVDDYTAYWCAVRLEERINRIHGRSQRRPDLLDRETLIEHIAGYQVMIGDIEQALPGESRELDDLVSRAS